MANKSLLMLLLLCVMAVAVSANVVKSAGGDNGWNIRVYMEPITISSGDSVKFTYPSNQHNVFQVSKDDYDSCYTGSPIASYYSGADLVTLYNPDTYYFICGVYGHCDDKMKLIVYVQ